MFRLMLLFWTCFSVLNGFAQSKGTEIDDEQLNFQYQTQHRRLMLSGDFGLGLGFRNSSTSVSNANFMIDGSLTPKIGYFVRQNWLVGTSLDFFGSLITFNYTKGYQLYYGTFGIYNRYYHKSGLFAEIQYGFGGGVERRQQNDDYIKALLRGNRLTAGLGIANFWFKRINFELMLRYNYSWGDYPDNEDNPFSINGLGLTAGMGYVLGGKKTNPK